MNTSSSIQSFKNLLNSLKRKWPLFIGLLVILTIVLEAGTFWYTYRQTNEVTYSATTKVLITPNQKRALDGGNLQVYLNTEKAIIGSEKFADYLKKDMTNKIGLKDTELVDYQVDSENGTSIIVIQATAQSEKKAIRIGKYIGKMIVENPMNILQGGKAQVIDSHSRVNVNGVSAGKSVYLYSFVIAMMISLIGTLIIAYYDQRIYDAVLISKMLPKAHIYQISDKYEAKDTFQKILHRRDSLLKNNNLSVLYFKNVELISTELVPLLIDQKVQQPIKWYSDNKNQNSIASVKQLSIADLYGTSEEQVSDIELIDCSTTINSGSNDLQMIIIKKGENTKLQLNLLANELGQLADKKVFVVYIK